MRTVTKPYQDPRATTRTIPWIVTVRSGASVENLKSQSEDEASAVRAKLINQGYEPV